MRRQDKIALIVLFSCGIFFGLLIVIGSIISNYLFVKGAVRLNCTVVHSDHNSADVNCPNQEGEKDFTVSAPFNPLPIHAPVIVIYNKSRPKETRVEDYSGTYMPIGGSLIIIIPSLVGLLLTMAQRAEKAKEGNGKNKR